MGIGHRVRTCWVCGWALVSVLRAPVAACSLAALFALRRLLLLCLRHRFFFRCSGPRDRRSKRSQHIVLSGGAERAREATRQRLACWLDALAPLLDFLLQAGSMLAPS